MIMNKAILLVLGLAGAPAESLLLMKDGGEAGR